MTDIALERPLIDTDVLIDYLRGYPAAIAYLDSIVETLLISIITVAELYSGVREGNERAALSRFLSAFDVVPVNAEIAVQGGLFRRDFGKSHGVGLADALIAATARFSRTTLVTLNQKHFPMLDAVHVPYTKA